MFCSVYHLNVGHRLPKSNLKTVGRSIVETHEKRDSSVMIQV